jgi:hypothetical protein
VDRQDRQTDRPTDQHFETKRCILQFFIVAMPKIDLGDFGCGVMNLIELAQDKVLCWNFVVMEIINLWIA